MPETPSPVDQIRARFLGLIPRMILLHDTVARESGLTAAELQALHVIDLHEGPISPSELSDETGLPRSTVTRVLTGLAEAGYITRSAVPSDLRRASITTDPKATATVGARFDVYAEAMAALNRQFDGPELEVLARYWIALGDAVDRGFSSPA